MSLWIVVTIILIVLKLVGVLYIDWLGVCLPGLIEYQWRYHM